MDEFELWRAPDGVALDDPELLGHRVLARDGGVGVVIGASPEVGSSHLIVRARPWLPRSIVMLPAGLIAQIDPQARVVSVAAERSEIANAPALDSDRVRDRAYRAELGLHYARRRCAGVAAL